MKKKTKIYPWKMYFHVLLGMFFLLPALLNAQNTTIKVSGIVTDTNNEPLIGVSVAEKGTTNGAITDVDGKYSLTVRPKYPTLLLHQLQNAGSESRRA